MQKFKGRLQYMGWSNLPWRLVMDNGEIVDLRPIVGRFLVSLNGQRAEHDQERDSYTLAANENSEFKLNYVPGKYILLEKTKGFAGSNVQNYLDRTLTWLSGRLVEIDIEEGKQIRFVADKSEEVYGVYFSDKSNFCEVPEGAEETVCKIGQPDCCIFLSLTPDGFQCEKFGFTARILLDRLAKKDLNASRIGNCALLGQKE